ncbi:hypothetical protein OHC33_001272 [Knufia fluminis]|uniref:Uncharacterized protein n=1 Tax=Knufia fluminis TaxID=191047 RepID=A0AAN8I7D8_9EURO|nr:hypothetical protein OHC33_001272 [Knufia fluminis]
MRHNAHSLLVSAAAFTLVAAGDSGSTWLQWTSSAPAPAPAVTTTVTVWSKSIETQYTTDTSYISVTTTETEYKPVTQFVTVTPPTVTTTQFDTVVQTDTVTDTVVSVSGSIATVQQTVEETIENTILATATATVVNTVNNDITITVTSFSAVTEYVSLTASCPNSTSGTGITLCPSRTINPTYTPPTPLPSNYLWGCPPGKLCHPPRINCNFEQNLPADTYVCAPEECIPVAPLPPLRTFVEDEPYINDTCAWYTPIDDYFNIDPRLFGLDFDIFNIYGQPTCPPPPPPPPSTTPPAQPPSTTWAAWNSPVTSAGWNNWKGSHTGPAPSVVTKRAYLFDKKAVIAPKPCWPVCNQAMQVWQSDRGCSSWRDAFALVTSCTSKYAGAPVTSVVSQMNSPIATCARQAKRTAAAQLEDAAPAFRFARG